MNSLIRKLREAQRTMSQFELGFISLDDTALDKLEREIEYLEQELARPIRTTEEVKDDTDTSDL